MEIDSEATNIDWLPFRKCPGLAKLGPWENQSASSTASSSPGSLLTRLLLTLDKEQLSPIVKNIKTQPHISNMT